MTARIVRVETSNQCYRIIPSKYPAIALFEDVADADEFDALYELQALTYPRIIEEAGDIGLVQKEHRVYGSGSSWIMAAFTHLNPDGSRFSRGDYGIYYAGCSREVAIAETRYHREKFMANTHEPAQQLDMRVLVATIEGSLHNLSGRKKEFESVYHDNDYTAGQRLGRELRSSGSAGIRYSSVRHHLHDNCYAVFIPSILSKCRQGANLAYHWDGKNITDIYEKKAIT